MARQSRGKQYRSKEDKFRRRINDQIKAKEVRLIDDLGEQLGIVSINQARTLAEDQELDLVEVAPNAKPPVCKIMDYGKYLYQQTKKSQEAKKKQKTFNVKEVKFRVKTDEHDYNFKVNHIIRFLKQGDKAKVSLMFRGREATHKELAFQMFEQIAKEVEEYGEVEKNPTLDGRNLIMILTPIEE